VVVRSAAIVFFRRLSAGTPADTFGTLVPAVRALGLAAAAAAKPEKDNGRARFLWKIQ